MCRSRQLSRRRPLQLRADRPLARRQTRPTWSSVPPMAGSERPAPSRPLRLLELLASVSLAVGSRDRSAPRPCPAHLHDRRRARRRVGMRSGRGPRRPAVRAPPLPGLHVRRGGDRRHGRWRRRGLQRGDGSGDHGLASGDHGTARAQRGARLSANAAPAAGRPRARRSEGRSALAGDALRGGGHAGRTRRHGAAGRRCTRPCLRALGWKRVSGRARGRLDPPRGADRRRGEGRRPRNHARRRSARVDARAEGPGV